MNCVNFSNIRYANLIYTAVVDIAGQHHDPNVFGYGHHTGEGAGPSVPVAADA